jgi:hypothetical protein
MQLEDIADITVGAIKEASWTNDWTFFGGFKLYYLGDGKHRLWLDETAEKAPEIDESVTYDEVTLKRTLKAGVWNTFVSPFAIPADTLSGWEVKELTHSSFNGEVLSLTFEDVTDGIIQAGVPYMVRNVNQMDVLTSFSMENVVVNTSFNNVETEHVEFVGTYTDGYVPEGGGFISNNVFYQASEPNTNRLKGFRAYLRIFDPEVRSISYRMADNEDEDENDGDGTSVDSSTAEVTSVAIYNTQGVRLETMQEGLNIILMSDGSVVKVMMR